MKRIFLVAMSLMVMASLLVSCNTTDMTTEEEVAPAEEEAVPAEEADAEEAASADEASAEEAEDVYMPDYPEPPEGTEMVDTTKWKKDPPWTIGYANASTANSFRQFTVAALYWIADQHPELVKEIVHTNANQSIPKQIADVEDLIVQGVDVIILASESASALVPAVDAAMEAGIPVIILERGVEGTNFATYIDVNPVGIATYQAQAIADALDGEGNVVTYGIIPGTTIAKDQEGAIQAVWDENPGINELAFDYGLAQLAKGKELMEAWLQTYPEIDAVLGWNGAEIRGAVEAAKEAGRYDEIKFWAAKDEMGYLGLIKNGLPGVGVVGYADCTIDAFEAAVRILSGEPVPFYWRLPAQEINSENIDDYYVEGAPDNWFPSRMAPEDIEKYLEIAATK